VAIGQVIKGGYIHSVDMGYRRRHLLPSRAGSQHLARIPPSLAPTNPSIEIDIFKINSRIRKAPLV
jgi:hypothetical protein